MAWKLVEAAGNAPTRQTGFPIFDTAKQYEDQAPQKIEGMSEFAIEKIRVLNPHKAGNRDLWVLHRLDIIERHRLTLTLATGSFAESMTASERASRKEEYSSRHDGPVPPGLIAGIILKIRVPRVLKPGDELKRIPASQAEEDVKFYFDVTLDEAEVTQGFSFYILFEMMRSEVRRILDNFAPLL